MRVSRYTVYRNVLADSFQPQLYAESASDTILKPLASRWVSYNRAACSAVFTGVIVESFESRIDRHYRRRRADSPGLRGRVW